MNSLWTGPKVARIVGVSYDTLDYWVKSGLITPNMIILNKSKSRWYYSYADIIIVAALKALRDRGISLQKLKRAKTELCQRIGMSLEQGIDGGVIVADGRDVLAVLYTLNDAIQIMSLLKGGQMILPLDNIVADIEYKLMQMFDEEAISVDDNLIGEEARHER
jgi:DNA-binding transcriptional MerR regulator